MTEGRTLVVLRHGRTAWNDTGQAQGHTDIPLDEVGRAQARATAVALAALAPVHLWSSDLARARHTAEAVGAVCGLEPVLDSRLREYDVGERAGLTLDEFSQKFPEEYAAWITGDESVRVAGAETTSEVRARIAPAMRECLDALGPGETGVVVSHGASLKVGVSDLLGLGDAHGDLLRGMANCGWLRLSEHPRFGRLQLVSYNETVPHEPSRGADFASDGASG